MLFRNICRISYILYKLKGIKALKDVEVYSVQLREAQCLKLDLVNSYLKKEIAES